MPLPAERRRDRFDRVCYDLLIFVLFEFIGKFEPPESRAFKARAL